VNVCKVDTIKGLIYGVKFFNLDTKSIIIIDNYVKNKIKQ